MNKITNKNKATNITIKYSKTKTQPESHTNTLKNKQTDKQEHRQKHTNTHINNQKKHMRINKKYIKTKKNTKE